jgi:hypothetical protein
MNNGIIKQLSATGDVTAADAHLKAVVLLGGSAASTIAIKAGGSSGTTVLTMKAAIDTVVPSGDLHDAYCAGGIHVTVTGAGALATFVYE